MKNLNICGLNMSQNLEKTRKGRISISTGWTILFIHRLFFHKTRSGSEKQNSALNTAGFAESAKFCQLSKCQNVKKSLKVFDYRNFNSQYKTKIGRYFHKHHNSYTYLKLLDYYEYFVTTKILGGLQLKWVKSLLSQSTCHINCY